MKSQKSASLWEMIIFNSVNSNNKKKKLTSSKTAERKTKQISIFFFLLLQRNQIFCFCAPRRRVVKVGVSLPSEGTFACACQRRGVEQLRALKKGLSMGKSGRTVNDTRTVCVRVKVRNNWIKERIPHKWNTNCADCVSPVAASCCVLCIIIEEKKSFYIWCLETLSLSKN